MTLLTIGVSLFVLIHLIPSATPLRNALNNGLGEKAYKGMYSLVALTGFGLMIYGKAYAEFVPVWSPPAFSMHVAWLMMIPALILVVGANGGISVWKRTRQEGLGGWVRMPAWWAT